VFQRVPQIEITATYRVIEMDLKKIMALVMVALLALPSLIMVVRADEPEDSEDGTGLAGAIERAHLYLDKVRISAANLATEYPDNEMIQGYLDEINDLLGQGGEADPENLLETTGVVGSGNEDRVRIYMPEGTVLNDIVSLSWDYYLYYGYAPHVDIMVDTDDDTVIDDALVFEYAYNDAVGYHMDEGQPTYGCLYDAWYATFSDDGEGPAAVTDTSYAWPTTGPAGPFGTVCFTLADWKNSITYGSKTIDGGTPVLALEFEVDNYMAQTKAVINNIKMNDDVIYNFEEELEDLGAEGFLNRASVCLGEGQFNSTARNLAAARNILGRVNGLLNSMAKAHKVARTDRFMRQFAHRLEGLEDKMYRLRGRLGEGANNFKASIGLAKGRLGQLDEDPGDDVDLDELESTTGIIDAGFEGLEAETLEAIYRLEAKIRVLKASAERLRKKGCVTDAVDDELDVAEALLNGMMDSLEGGNTEEAESHIEETDGLVSDAKDRLKEIRKQHQNKGSQGKGRN